MTAETVALRFFSLTATVESDVAEVTSYTRALFGRFVEAEAPAGPVDYALRIVACGNGRWHVTDCLIDAEVDQPTWLTGVVAARLLETVGNEVTDHDLFHAAALERDGRGLVICGESGFGKSTLSLSLLDRGFRFLSDEVAVVDGSGMLLPFPKALEMRPASEAIRLPPGGTPGRSGKRLYDVEHLGAGSLGRACRLSNVIFLESHDESAKPPAGRLRVTLHRRPAGLPESVRAMEGVIAAEWAEEAPVLFLCFDPERFAAWTLPEVVARHGTLIVDSSAETRPPTDFDHEPTLEPLAAPEGLRRLLGQFRGSRALPKRLEAHDGDFGALFVSVLDRLHSVRFARLLVGRLPRTLELIAKLTR